MQKIPLGKQVKYVNCYTPSLLCPIPRSDGREFIGIYNQLPFEGYDVWNCYEVSWLNPKGKPMVAVGELIFPVQSPNLVESKSIKLYLNSFNNTEFTSLGEVATTIKTDLTAVAKAEVVVRLKPIIDSPLVQNFGICIDDLDVECLDYTTNPDYLTTENEEANETLYSNLFKSNCPVTSQPDFATIVIKYLGKKINREGLLKYIISFRNEMEFHEQCIEKIFIDLMKQCAPAHLAVSGRFARRGGIDINPHRFSTKDYVFENRRTPRQ